VARSPDLPHLKRALDAIGIHHGTPESRAVGLVVRDLCDAEELPSAGDLFRMLAPDERGIGIASHGRQVPGRDLWVWYFANGDVKVMAVTRGL
jgi:hypothetical protein